MTGYLLDVNALVALFWEEHTAHTGLQRWFQQSAGSGWATCPFTQAGLVRVISNPAFSPKAYSLNEACRLLERNLSHRHHSFWKADISIERAFAPFGKSLSGHRQVTDAYLLGLAIHRDGKLATLDRSLHALLPDASPHRRHIELITA